MRALLQMGSRTIDLVFMLEEESAEVLLRTLLPEILSVFPEVAVHSGDSLPDRRNLSGNTAPEVGVVPTYIPHQGRGHLQRSIPNKLNGWLKPQASFVILHDQDSHECVQLKRRLQKICGKQQRYSPLIRIACTELEAWYFGDLDAVERAFPGFRADEYKNKARYRIPDRIKKPSKELKKIVKDFQKGVAARAIPTYMDISSNTSVSFKHLVTGIQDMVREQLKAFDRS